LPLSVRCRRPAVEGAVLTLAGAVALALSARISLPLVPVPVSAQTLAVLLVGALLGPTRGTLSVLSYLCAGAAGLPVFSGNPAYTGGYLLGFAPAAWLAGVLIQRGWGRRAATLLLALLIADAVIFAFGLGWLAALPRTKGVLAAGLVRFLPGEAVKITIAALVIAPLRKPAGETDRFCGF